MDSTAKSIKRLPMMSCFEELKDPRVMGRCRHLLQDIIALTISGVLCGAQHWTEIEEFGRSKYQSLKKILSLPNGIPTHYTIGRVFSKLCPQLFLDCFIKWMDSVTRRTKGEIVAIDGKTLRRSHDRKKEVKPLHIINAFAAANGLTLGQLKTPDKTNEIKAIPLLLKRLQLTGCIVTMDAMGCQKGIAKLVKNQGADYVLAVKLNQKGLHKKIDNLYKKAEVYEYKNMVYQHEEQIDYGHGRIELRHYTTLPLCYHFSLKRNWPGLQSFLQVKRTRIIGNEVSQATHYYISSLDMRSHRKISKAVRYHWRVENNCHWVLDTSFDEDQCRVRKGHAGENFSLIRKMVMNILQLQKSGKVSFDTMRLRAAWNGRYFRNLLDI